MPEHGTPGPEDKGADTDFKASSYSDETGGAGLARLGSRVEKQKRPDKEAMTPEERAKDDALDNAAGQLAAEALGGQAPEWSEIQKGFTSEDWQEARRRGSSRMRF
jgi:hypothetical protein